MRNDVKKMNFLNPLSSVMIAVQLSRISKPNKRQLKSFCTHNRSLKCANDLRVIYLTDAHRKKCNLRLGNNGRLVFASILFHGDVWGYELSDFHYLCSLPL